jgi:hypothetical protein
MVVHEVSQDRRNEKGHGIQDPKRKGSLQQRACLAELLAEWVVGLVSAESKRAQGNVEGADGEIGAGGIGDVAQLVDPCDECPDEAEIDEADEEG